jgi:PleD family two-component response regulator
MSDADEALYRAKHEGRNRVSLSERQYARPGAV